MPRLLTILRSILLFVLGTLIIVPVALILAIFIALNTGAGRHFVSSKIRALTHNTVRITRLSGHFPADIAAGRIELADRKGIYLTITHPVLRWHPAALLSSHLSITSLTAQTVTLARLPVPAKPPAKPTKSGIKLPFAHINLDHLAIHQLIIAAPVTGHPISLDITGHASDFAHHDISVDLLAIAANHRGHYHIIGTLTPNAVQSTLTASEPANGPIGLFIGPKLDQSGLALHATIHGPRTAAQLTLTAALGALRATAHGTLGLNPTAPRANLTVNLPDLAPFAALAKQQLAGQLSLHAQLASSKSGQSARFTTDANITGGAPSLVKWLGPKPQLSGAVSTDHGTIALHQLNVQTSLLNANLAGRITPSNLSLQGALRETNITLVDPQLTGHVTERVAISGPRTDFSLTSTVSGVIAAKSVRSGPFTFAVAANHLPHAPHATVIGAGSLDGEKLSVNGKFTRSSTGIINATLNQLTWKSVQGAGHVTITPRQWPTGAMTISIGQLADLGKLLNVAIKGSLHAAFSHISGQPITLSATLQQFGFGPQVSLAAASLTGQLTHPAHQPTMTARAILSGLRAPQLAGNLILAASGPLRSPAITATGRFSQLAGRPASINLAGVVSTAHHSVTITRLFAAARGLTLNLQHTTAIEWQPNLAVNHLAIALGGLGAGGSLTLNGTIRPHLAASLALHHIPASIIQAAIPALRAQGQLNAAATLTGALATPQGTITIALNRLHLATGPAASLPPVTATVAARLHGRSATGTATLHAGAKSRLKFSGSVPISAKGPLALTVRGAIDLGLLEPLTAAQGTRIAGTLTPDLQIGGTPARPKPSGTVTLAGGVLQNISSGLDLSNITSTLGASGHNLILRSLHATAGRGTITGTGTIGLIAPMPINLVIQFNRAQPITSDIITETLGGQVKITGAVKTGVGIGGQLDIDQANITIPHALPPSVADLTIIRPGQKLPQPAAPLPINLNLTILAKNQIFIRGDGIFADLGGRLHLGGTAAAPSPSGGLNLLRGHFSLGGKSLAFTKGDISFNGGLMPELNLQASHSAADGTVSTLAVTGTPTAPKITLSSVPYLPSDEVLSHLLYGTGTARLSAFQAASLAASLAQLAGVGGGLNPLGGVRNALGLDELSLGGGSGSGAPTVNAGRYVAPGVYVGASQSASGQGSQVKVEINLYKGLKLNTAVGNGSGSGTSNGESVGLGYQFNY